LFKSETGWRGRGGRGNHTARKYKHRIRELHNREMPQIARVDRMAPNTEQREQNRQAVNHGKQDLRRNNPVNQPRQNFLREHGVLFYKLGEVVKPRRCCGLSVMFAPRQKPGKIWLGVGGGVGMERIPMARVRKPKPSKTPA